MGFHNKIVLWDETTNGVKRKYHRGRTTKRPTSCIAGGVELSCTPNNSRHVCRCFIEPLQMSQTRSKSNLLQCICTLVTPGAVIWTDALSTYHILGEKYTFSTVCHQREFDVVCSSVFILQCAVEKVCSVCVFLPRDRLFPLVETTPRLPPLPSSALSL